MRMIEWVMSGRAIPRSFRFMEGFGVHTFRFLNAKDESTFVKFHWKPKLGQQSVVCIPIRARLSAHQPGGPQGVLDNLLHPRRG